MKSVLIAVVSAVQAYLLGSIDTGILVSKFLYHDDVRKYGSGAAGMTNMLRTFGKKAAALTAFGDVLKGVLAVCIGRWLFTLMPESTTLSPYLAVYLAAIFAIIGHLKPLYFGFKGGKGVLVAGGTILAIQPVLIPFLAVIFLACLLPTGMVSLGSVTMAALYPVLTILYLFVLDWRLALLSLVVFPVAFFFMMTVMGGYGKDYAGAVQATTEMSTTLIEYINGIEVIKAFNQGSKSYAKLTDKVRYNAQYYVNWMKKSQLGMAMAYGFFPAQMLTILPVGWLLWLHGSLTAETFLTVIVLALGMAAPIVAAFNFVDTLAQVGTTVGQVDEILNAEEQQHSTTPVTFAGHDIVLDHVSFDYHDDKEILHDVSLSIPAGRMTALVGPSGSGKSTIAKLAAGFWDVKTGSITLGGRDLKDIPLQQLYEQTAFVSQDNYLFDDTVRENIRMGRLNATDAEVEAAAHAAGCDSFIGELEHGYDTMVGGGGAHLSGDEKQRISIARAMLKDAPIVILDEATANVDPENEDRLQKAIEALTRDKTIIMIAHRLKTVCHADQILVVDHGRIVQQGTHEQLIGQPGIYAAFVGGRKQAEGWKL